MAVEPRCGLGFAPDVARTASVDELAEYLDRKSVQPLFKEISSHLLLEQPEDIERAIVNFLKARKAAKRAAGSYVAKVVVLEDENFAKELAAAIDAPFLAELPRASEVERSGEKSEENWCCTRWVSFHPRGGLKEAIRWRQEQLMRPSHIVLPPNCSEEVRALARDLVSDCQSALLSELTLSEVAKRVLVPPAPLAQHYRVAAPIRLLVLGTKGSLADSVAKNVAKHYGCTFLCSQPAQDVESFARRVSEVAPRGYVARISHRDALAAVSALAAAKGMHHGQNAPIEPSLIVHLSCGDRAAMRRMTIEEVGGATPHDLVAEIAAESLEIAKMKSAVPKAVVKTIDVNDLQADPYPQVVALLWSSDPSMA